MFFRKKIKKESKESFCLHEWQLVDYYTDTFNTGVAVEVDDYYKLGCPKCKTYKSVEEYELFRMRDLGLIKDN
ncbi:hypothetical protein BEH_07595 [Priestia filamentosa]|uniref:Uncharacterized protein n=1 Tax=Priestia filamentosa TaxID=1402861 RepID=A0A0H4KUJ7_9BACI|nr:hypothetical protein [Priestia filamentosa]AKO91973.1 hypothetical protein BEH_07595 [Priestia filamentosa]